MISKRLSLALLLPFIQAVLYAQNYQGAVRGTVSDASGAAIGAVKITLADQATNVARNTVTNAQGEYVFSSVEPATYSLTAESPNFKKFIRRDVLVATQASVTTDLQLELGTVSQSIEVSEEAPQLESSNASNGQVIDSQKLSDLPNLGRNPFLFAKLSTNVVPVGDPRFNRFQDQSGSSQISIAGGPIRGNNYTIDGVPITDSVNRAVIIPSIEGTQEMKLQENTYDATMGRTGGGVFNTFLKSGSNALHGSLLGYTRQTDWLANTFFRNASGQPIADQPQYNWGGSFGGPIWVPKVYDGRNKTFFYVVTESYRQKSPLTDQYTLPTAAERAGRFFGEQEDSLRSVYFASLHRCRCMPDRRNDCAQPVCRKSHPGKSLQRRGASSSRPHAAAANRCDRCDQLHGIRHLNRSSRRIHGQARSRDLLVVEDERFLSALQEQRAGRQYAGNDFDCQQRDALSSLPQGRRDSGQQHHDAEPDHGAQSALRIQSFPECHESRLITG